MSLMLAVLAAGAQAQVASSQATTVSSAPGVEQAAADLRVELVSLERHAPPAAPVDLDEAAKALLAPVDTKAAAVQEPKAERRGWLARIAQRN